MKPAFTISQKTQRRFILGRQGLWPGRRWRGKQGVLQASRTCEAIQLDPLNVVARSHEIALWGRVLDYESSQLDELMYQERQLFDYGGALFIYPIQELPYWRLHMQRAATWERQHAFAEEHPHVLEQVRSALRTQGPLGNKDFTGNKRVNSYRGSKDTALALYYLWLTGEVMIHHRNRFDRVYDFRTNILPSELDYTVSEEECLAYFGRKAISFFGLIRDTGWRVAVSDFIQRRLEPQEARQRLQVLVESGEVCQLQVDGIKEPRYALGSDLAVLQVIESGGIPAEWQPLETTNREEVIFLAPLEIASARGRAGKIFNFEYLWEVYKPAELRRWGYYTLPILYGDRLVARLDLRLDRKAGTLLINGFWLEADQSADDIAFCAALSRGLERFARFIGAGRILSKVILPTPMPEELRKSLSIDFTVEDSA